MKTTSARRTAPAVRTIAVAAVLAAGLAGCASRTSTSAASGSTADGVSGQSAPITTSAPATPSASAPTTGVNLPSPGAAPSKPSGGAATASPTVSGAPVTKVFSPAGLALGGDKQTLSVPVEWGGCTDKPEIVVTAQDSMKVVVEMKQVSHAGAGKMCPDHVQVGTATLTLASPLGGRTLVDATTNAPIPVH